MQPKPRFANTYLSAGDDEPIHIYFNTGRQPSGWFVRIVLPVISDQKNAFLNHIEHEMMEVRFGDLVLKIGCGTRKLTYNMASVIDTGVVEVVDFSSGLGTMQERKDIADGKVQIFTGNFDQLLCEEESYLNI